MLRSGLLVLVACCVWLLAHESYRIGAGWLRIVLADSGWNWHRDWPALLADRLCYGLLVTGAGWLLLRIWLAPPAGQPTPANALSTSGAGARTRAWAIGVAAGCGLFAGVWLLHQILVGLSLAPQGTRPELSAALSQGWQQILLHLLFSAVFTAVLEELFFRGALQAWLHAHGVAPPVAIGTGAILFALVHPVAVWPVLCAVGVAFGFLFWRWGPGSTILAHAVYNALLILSRSLFQE